MLPAGPRARTSILAILLLAPVLAGCVTPGDDPLTATLTPGGVTMILLPDGTPAAFAAVTAIGPTAVPVAVLSTDAAGILRHDLVPATAATLAIVAAGAAPWTGSVDALPATLTLRTAEEQDGVLLDTLPILRFATPSLLGRAYLAGQAATCEQYNCGASEPTVEVAADGTIYASGVCCVGESPPIWVSRDGGATFTELEGDLLRDTFGIEGDFAIDDAGNMYFTDISVASAYISSWDKDGNHRWTIPVGAFMPIVDRPWVRAGAEDEVYFLYNTGVATNFYKSTDGGLTWMFKHQFGANLGNIGQGPERDHLWVEAGDDLYESTDGGETWSTGYPIPLPTASGGRSLSYHVPVVDEAGNVWLVSDWRNADEDAYHVYAVRRDPEGAWHGPYMVSPENGTHHLPWAAAGRDGTLTVAWYGSPEANADTADGSADAPWYVYAATTVNGNDDTPVFQVVKADPDPVLYGQMGRRLLDFLQIDVGPDGTLHLVYAQDRDGTGDEATQYVQAPSLLGLAPAVYPNGPR